METDLTPTEARAEVEAFMGEGWTCLATRANSPREYCVDALRPNTAIAVGGSGPTYRAAVDALKQSWRDAVRPWMEEAIEAKLDTADVDGYAPTDDVISRVLKESDHEA